MVFLALLAIAIGVLLALSLVLVGLVEAPWPVLLIGLLAALYGLQKVLADSQVDLPLTDIELTQERSQAPPQPEPMSQSAASNDEEVLTYRGIRYRVAKPHEQPHHAEDTLVEGIYRGQHWQRWRPMADKSDQPSKNSEVTYRGHKVINPEHDA